MEAKGLDSISRVGLISLERQIPFFWKASLVSKPTKVSFCFTSSLESLEGPRKSFSFKEELAGIEEGTKLILLSLRAYFVANGFARLPNGHLAVGSIRPTC